MERRGVGPDLESGGVPEVNWWYTAVADKNHRSNSDGDEGNAVRIDTGREKRRIWRDREKLLQPLPYSHRLHEITGPRIIPFCIPPILFRS